MSLQKGNRETYCLAAKDGAERRKRRLEDGAGEKETGARPESFKSRAAKVTAHDGESDGQSGGIEGHGDDDDIQGEESEEEFPCWPEGDRLSLLFGRASGGHIGR
jgi:hypothetical protein